MRVLVLHVESSIENDSSEFSMLRGKSTMCYLCYFKKVQSIRLCYFGIAHCDIFG